MEVLQEILKLYWVALILLALAISFSAFTHIVTTKHDVRAAIGWSSVVWLVPFFGALFYFLFGVNRIERKAARIRGAGPKTASARRKRKIRTALSTTLLRRPEIRAHVRLMDAINDFPFVPENKMDYLVNGDQAFAKMLAAIAVAKKSIGLQTFIFDFDAAGRKFVEALEAAKERGVAVRVLVDTVGALYYRPSIIKVLKKRGIPVARFNRSLAPWRMAYLNLRNHRKILIVDGKLAFTGGMNIRQGNYQDAEVKKIIQDLHFILKGPITSQLGEVFARDWAFATDEILDDRFWLPKISKKSNNTAYARGIADGPDGDVKKTRWAIISALGMAKRSVKIMTPYFLPDRTLVSALNHAALRGVNVDILLPALNNLKYVQWASKAQYGQVLEGGCRIYHSPGPFDHGKILIVDDHWFLMGSTNWDPRSFRLNFEFNVEVFDKNLTGRLKRMVEKRIKAADEVTLEKIKAMSKVRRALYGWVWLFSPYL